MTSHICGGQGGSESVTSYLPECVFQLKKFLSVKKYELRSTGVAHTHTRRGLCLVPSGGFYSYSYSVLWIRDRHSSETFPV